MSNHNKKSYLFPLVLDHESLTVTDLRVIVCPHLCLGVTPFQLQYVIAFNTVPFFQY